MEHPGIGTDMVRFPRPLLLTERETLEFVLKHTDFAGRDALLEQASAATVTGQCTCGCASVDLAVPPDLPAAPPQSDPNISTPIQNEATVFNDEGEPIGGVLVFVKDGHLSYLEVYDFGDGPINPFPPTDHLRPEVTGATPS